MATPSSGKSVPKASLTSFIKGKTFTFIVGPEKTQYYIHVEALKAISEPLGYLMTNGKMEESIRGEAALPEVEPEIFEQLFKFAYQGLCGMSDNVVGDHVKPPSSKFRCRNCGLPSFAEPHYPFCTVTCQKKLENKSTGFGSGNHRIYCVFPTCVSTFQSMESTSVLCSIHNLAENRAVFSEVNARKPKVIPGQFYLLNYSVTGLPHAELCDLLEKHRVCWSTIVPLVHHAKLYALANQYLVEDLRYTCLYKLHRYLANFKTTADNIDKLADLLTYTYSNTEDGGDILEAKSDPLRRFIIYIAEHSSTILKHEGFREVLGAAGAHTADFMALKYT